jgi:uncharacterized membrane protein
MKFFGQIFGNSEFSLRLQSIIAHCIYLLFSFLIVRQFRSSLLIIGGFIILNINPYFLDFFSLARGYALSIAFMMMSIYYYMQFMEKGIENKKIYSLIAASLALFSNFALLNFLAALLILDQLFLYSKYRSFKVNIKKSSGTTITFVILLILCYEPLRKLIKYKRFDFGGATGIWNDTVNSEITCFFYHQDYSSTIHTLVGIAIILTLSLFFILKIRKMLSKKISDNDRSGMFILGLLFFILLSNALQHHLLGSPYIMERFALFITPLFLLIFLFLINDSLESMTFIKYSGFGILASSILLMAFHFLRSANLESTWNWKYDSDTKQMLQDLDDHRSNEKMSKVSLGITWLFEPTINFYRITKKLNWLEKVTRDPISWKYNYYYVTQEDEKMLETESVTLNEYPVSGNKLIKKPVAKDQ